MTELPRRRAIFYIDGYNLYYGLREYRNQSNPNFYWLNLERLAENVMGSLPAGGYDLVAIKYFTTLVDYNPQKASRQAAYVQAISTLEKVSIIKGTFLMKDVKCRSCSAEYKVPGEKKTDVNIAVNLLRDAVQDRYDTAFLISGDTDLVPAIEAVLEVAPAKSIVAAFPPNRAPEAIKAVVTDYRKINRKWLEKSQFPLDFQAGQGQQRIHCPAEWRNSE